jgi:cytochrome P450
MVTARDGADRLSDEEIIGVCVVVLIAGHDTTMNSMALGTVALVRHSQAREYLLEHPDSLSNSIMELARFIAMSTMQPRVGQRRFRMARAAASPRRLRAADAGRWKPRSSRVFPTRRLWT